MKLTKALLVASVLGFGSLTGCIGTEVADPAEEVADPAEEVADPAEEDSQQVTGQTTCVPIPGATAVSPGLTCSHFGFPFNHYKPYYTQCTLLYCSDSGAWSYKRISTNNQYCDLVEDLYCS